MAVSRSSPPAHRCPATRPATLIDGTLHGLAGLARLTAGMLGRVQTGSLHLYAWLVLTGIFACLLWSWHHV